MWVVPWTLRAAQGRAPGRQPGDRLRYILGRRAGGGNALSSQVMDLQMTGAPCGPGKNPPGQASPTGPGSVWPRRQRAELTGLEGRPQESLELFSNNLASFSRHVPLLLEVRPGCVTGFEPLKVSSRCFLLGGGGKLRQLGVPVPPVNTRVKASAGPPWTRGSRRSWTCACTVGGCPQHSRAYPSPTAGPPPTSGLCLSPPSPEAVGAGPFPGDAQTPYSWVPQRQ